MSKFRVGQLVESGSGRVGAIIAVRDEGPEPTYHVFVDGRSEPFFESQLSAVGEEVRSRRTSADALKCRLTALSLTNPSAETALSLNEGRIDHIPYQYRPVLRLLRADRPRLLIVDEVGVGKTIEAGLILRELHARR